MMDRIMMKVGNEAIAFYDVGKREYNDNIGKVKANAEGSFYRLIPAIVNLAFSIELSLKTFIDETEAKKCSHDLRRLFEKIGGSIQEALMRAIITQFSQHSTQFDEAVFWEYLDRNKNAFEDWRYYYQRGDVVDITFLYDMATVLKNFVEQIKEQLPSEN